MSKFQEQIEEAAEKRAKWLYSPIMEEDKNHFPQCLETYKQGAAEAVRLTMVEMERLAEFHINVNYNSPQSYVIRCLIYDMKSFTQMEDKEKKDAL